MWKVCDCKDRCLPLSFSVSGSDCGEFKPLWRFFPSSLLPFICFFLTLVLRVCLSSGWAAKERQVSENCREPRLTKSSAHKAHKKESSYTTNTGESVETTNTHLSVWAAV